ncbi:MAG: HAMP domain-containing histidine kinase [Armatimonadota bacterium]|nr:HAMP domain-containing histidine kinase [Armatimonadota bacterium]
MLKTLHGKLTAVLLGLLCLIGFLYVPLTLFTTRNYLDEVNQSLNRDLASQLASHLVSKNLLRNNPYIHKQTEAEITENMVLNPDIEIYILDDRGRILDSSAAPGEVWRDHVSLPPVRRFLAGRAALPILGDDPRHLDRQKVFSASPIPVDRAAPDRLRGYIYIILGGKKYESVAGSLGRSYIVRGSLWAALGGLLLLACVGALLFRILTRRLRRLTRAVEALQESDFSERSAFSVGAGLYRGDEIDRLGLVYSHMADRILAQVQTLRRADALRRELIGNVSHDLRTPLTALQGYLETLLMKEGEMTPEEQRQHLTVAARQGERLSTLVALLFDLAKLDAAESPPQIEPFSLGELVQDVAQQFQALADQRGLSLQTQFSPDLPFVCADIGLIARALENLLENALRYTPSGGSIMVALAPGAESVAVQVSDTGRGIPSEDLPHIFERSYRAGSQPESPVRAGLGLAITKRILELHGSDIDVRSVPGSGTVFTFPLPVCAPAP